MSVRRQAGSVETLPIRDAVLADVVELTDLFVRRGLGRSLVLDVVATARHLGIARVEVMGNDQARAFYENGGFVFDGDVATPFGSASRLHVDVSPDPL